MKPFDKMPFGSEISIPQSVVQKMIRDAKKEAVQVPGSPTIPLGGRPPLPTLMR